MLNLLIALMGNNTKFCSRGLALWRKEQSAIMLEEEFLYGNDLKIPLYLLILKCSSEVANVAIDNVELLEKNFCFK
jgi:hypothetical protein